MPYFAAFSLSTEITTSFSTLESPSSTSATPSTFSMAPETRRARSCRTSRSRPRTCREIPEPVSALISIMAVLTFTSQLRSLPAFMIISSNSSLESLESSFNSTYMVTLVLEVLLLLPPPISIPPMLAIIPPPPTMAPMVLISFSPSRFAMS